MDTLTRRALLGSALIPFAFHLPATGQDPKQDYDESKVRQYTLPDPLTMINGKRVNTPEAWEKNRRPEILRAFETDVYGRCPKRPQEMSWEVTSVERNALGGNAERKLVTIRFSKQKQSHSMDLLLYLPKRRSGAIPICVGVNFRGNQTVSRDPGIPVTTNWVYDGRNADHRATDATRGMQASQWPVERILERGYGLATFYAGDVSPDFEGGFELGVEPLFYKPGQTKRDPDEWGAIGAWAWGLSRAMDYLETDKDIDRRRVAVIGHSRMGKTALWAGARDARFAMVISNCSGAGGATLARRRFGESVKDLNTKFPWWFCENYRKFSDNEDALPVDTHELLALCAPRPLYIGVAEQDLGSDPQGQFLAALNASPVYKLLGKDGLGASEMPALHQPVMTTIGFHVRAGRHDITPYDWDQYMNFGDKHMR